MQPWLAVVPVAIAIANIIVWWMVFLWADGKLGATGIKAWRFLRGWREVEGYPGCWYQWWREIGKHPWWRR